MNRGKKSPLISIMIPHHGGKKILQECLDSLKSSDYSNLEILVLNNNSPDDSIKKIQPKFPDIKFIHSDKNHGFAGGCNILAKHSLGEYLLILNNDTIHKKNWINNLLKRIEKDDKIASVQPKINNFYNKNYFDHAGASGGFMDQYCFPFARGRIFNTIEKDMGQYDKPCQVFWASGTAFLTRKIIFDKMGGFDENLFAHMEEIDYHWRCQLEGYKVWVEPSSVIYHHGGHTLSLMSPKKTYLNYRNSLILLLTNHPLSTSIKLFFPRMLMESISLVREIIFLRWNHGLSIIKSWIYILFHIKLLINRRIKIKNKKTLTMISKKSIVCQYFIKGNKTFSTL
ncbi:MAG: glycosyltransferase family 2 protein [Candidatus Neomarinimicrobiota bacterium]|nr:glycosyltransferase family 2 protein [Candidatus Neomarinimicrobiota bacterium]|tara:strand:- start:1657 stop:2679 length:1023 start_codon:yes stop_codon:yes gene_type:complete